MPETDEPLDPQRRRPKRYLNVGTTQPVRPELMPANPHAPGSPGGVDVTDNWQQPRWPSDDDWHSPKFNDRVNRDKQGKFAHQWQQPRWKTSKDQTTAPSGGPPLALLRKKALDMANELLARDAEEFKEAEHPRDETGQFTAGGGAGKQAAEPKAAPKQEAAQIKGMIGKPGHPHPIGSDLEKQGFTSATGQMEYSSTSGGKTTTGTYRAYEKGEGEDRLTVQLQSDGSWTLMRGTKGERISDHTGPVDLNQAIERASDPNRTDKVVQRNTKASGLKQAVVENVDGSFDVIVQSKHYNPETSGMRVAWGTTLHHGTREQADAAFKKALQESKPKPTKPPPLPAPTAAAPAMPKRELPDDLKQLEAATSKMSDRDASFAQNLIDYYHKHGTLSVNQKPWVEKLQQRAAKQDQDPELTKKVDELRSLAGLALTGRDLEFANSLVRQHSDRGSLSDKQKPYLDRLLDKARKSKLLTRDAAMPKHSWDKPRWGNDTDGEPEVTADWSSDWRPPGWGKDAAFKEAEHPRDEGGQFTSGGSMPKDPRTAEDLALDSAVQKAHATVQYITAPSIIRPQAMAFDRALVHGALKSQLVRIAMDDMSMRTFSPDGHMHVALSNISRAQVSPYWGREIPDYEKFGLAPDKKYNLLRHPEELRKSTPTWNGVPLLITHQPISADDHPSDLVVGASGTDARYEHPFLKNSLHVWAKPAIDAIQSGKQRELSGAYHYVFVPQTGVYEGKPFDGLMRDISANHIALVESGRVGPAAIVADSMPLDLQIDEFFNGGG